MIDDGLGRGGRRHHAEPGPQIKAARDAGRHGQRVEIGGVRYSHIVDPHTGLGLTNRVQTTVIGLSVCNTTSSPVTIDVTVNDGTATSTQPVTIVIGGTNQAPVLAVDAGSPHNITEIAGKTGDTTDPDQATGTLSFFAISMPSLHAILPQIWLQRGPLARLLLPVSWLYGVLWRLRGLAYRLGWLRSAHPGIPVVVVGNVVAGGAGKTPTTIATHAAFAAIGIEIHHAKIIVLGLL